MALFENLKAKADETVEREKLTVNHHTAMHYSTIAMTLGFVMSAILDTVQEADKPTPQNDGLTTK